MAKQNEITNAIPEAVIPLDPNADLRAPEPETAVEEIAVPEQAPTENKPKRRKHRTLEELHESSYNKQWTDAETKAYIQYLRDKITMKDNKIQELVVSCQRFKEMFDNCDTAYQRLKTAANAREDFMKQLVSTCYASMMNMKEIKA